MNEIDRIWAMTPEELMGSPKDLDTLIRYQRKMQVLLEQGKVPKKDVVPEPHLLEKLLDLPKPEPVKVKFRSIK